MPYEAMKVGELTMGGFHAAIPCSLPIFMYGHITPINVWLYCHYDILEMEFEVHYHSFIHVFFW